MSRPTQPSHPEGAQDADHRAKRDDPHGVAPARDAEGHGATGMPHDDRHETEKAAGQG